jgi:thiamine biosynthesis lipoprotein
MASVLPIYRFSHQAMGTFFETVLAGVDEFYAGQAARAVFQEIDRIEGLFSRFNPCSEISQMNRMKPGDALIIGLETYEGLKIAEKVRVDTEGAFDINVRSLIQSPGLLGELRAGKKLAPLPSLTKGGGEEFEKPSAEITAHEFPSLELVQTSSGFEARLHSGKKSLIRSLELDLGGIGKGYALDKALAFLLDWGIDRALVHGGTSTVAAIGSPPSIGPAAKGWPVGVGGGWPEAPNQVLLMGRALSGSGTEVKGKHVMDPRTGLPAQAHLAAWASHPSAAEADALSTAFMVMATAEVEEYCALHPEVWALVIIDYGNCRVFNQEALPRA